MPTYFIKTFGCQQNTADSERISAYYESRGFSPAARMEQADALILNTCVIRDRAEEKVYGLVKNIRLNDATREQHIVITGCLVGAAAREPSGKLLKRLNARLPDIEFLPLEEVGFEHTPKRSEQYGKLASVVISNGCNNYCAFCIVPFSRGPELSRPYADIMNEVQSAVASGRDEILLLGQNVNSYGADFLQKAMKEKGEYVLEDGKKVTPIMVKHLNRFRIPTLFPDLLESVANTPGVRKLSFLSANPWDFSEELISVIAEHTNIERLLHLPVQAGSNAVLKRMNRWYTREEYLMLVEKIRNRIPNVQFTTDIIVGFPGETIEQFEETLDLVRQARFHKAYLAWYSPRPGTAATKSMPDDIPSEEKKRRYRELDHLILTLAGRGYVLESKQKAQSTVKP